jgi:hypothetical protein
VQRRDCNVSSRFHDFYVANQRGRLAMTFTAVDADLDTIHASMLRAWMPSYASRNLDWGVVTYQMLGDSSISSALQLPHAAQVVYIGVPDHSPSTMIFSPRMIAPITRSPASCFHSSDVCS